MTRMRRKQEEGGQALTKQMSKSRQTKEERNLWAHDPYVSRMKDMQRVRTWLYSLAFHDHFNTIRSFVTGLDA